MTMGFLGLALFVACLIQVASQENDCSPIYVRWPRVRLNLTSRVTGPYTLEECAAACAKDEHPGRPGYPLQCSGYNHKHGASNLANDCQLFQKDQIANLDGNVEYDDRYSYYWKYCVKAKEPCKSTYHFDFHIDRYMDYSESKRRVLTFQVEDCLEQCLQEKSFECRSVSFNRTAGYCYLSEESRLSKPSSVRVNSNPNYRIDYYENKCHNDCFTFHHECQSTGVSVSVESKFPYTGAMYGLYDFFSCRVEPKEETKFEYFFPFASISKNCSDSMTIKDGEYVLEVVLSTDNVIPLYFLTDEDLIYKAKCPLDSSKDSKVHYSASTIGAQVELVPPFSKSVEAVSQVALDYSSTASSSPASTSATESSTASSSSASAASTTVAITTSTSSENVTLEAADLWSKTSTNGDEVWEGSRVNSSEEEEEDAKPTESFAVKKPPEILPSLDSKPEEKKQGNKITLFVRYPKDNNETLPTEGSGESSSSSTTTESFWVDDPRVVKGSDRSTTESTTISTSPEASSSSSSRSSSTSTTSEPSTTESSTSSSTSSSSTPSSSSSSTSTPASSTSSPSSSSSSSTASSTSSSTSTTSSPSSSSSTTSSSSASSSSSTSTTEEPTSTSTTESSTSSSATTEISTSSSTSEPSSSSSTTVSSTSTTTEPTTESTTESTTKPSTPSSPSSSSLATTTEEDSHAKRTTWVYAWRFRLVTTTRAPSTTTEEEERPSSTSSSSTTTTSEPPAFVIDSKVVGIENDKQSRISSSLSTTTDPSSSSSSTTSQSSTPSSSGSTLSDLLSSTTSSTTTATGSSSSTAFWPFVLRTRSSTSADDSSSTSTTTTTSTTSTTPVSSTSTNVSIANFWNTTDGFVGENQTASSSTSSSSVSSESTSSSSTTISIPPTTPTTSGPPKKVLFDVFHNGQPVSAVVVGSRISLSFLPSLSLPGNYMTLVGCQVEPVNSPYAWERDPLQIVKNGCQADGVGLVCPPVYTDAGVKVEMEAFRYTTTGEVLYSCLMRVCPYGPCPQPSCTSVDGCNGRQRPTGVSIISPTLPNDPPIGLGRRLKRQLILEQQPSIPPVLSFLPINADLQQNLVTLAGDHVVTKKLVVVNSETELQYYLRTGNVPNAANGATFNGFLGR